MKILVVEDDRGVSLTLQHLLSSQSYAVDIVVNGQTALAMVEAFEYDLILLDRNLPGLDGIDICKRLRSQGYQMPILILTGLDDLEGKAAALNLGADDYVVKPFDSLELLARVQALLRRGKVTISPVLTWGNLRLDPSKREVTYSNQLLPLTILEFALLELFLRDPQKVWSQGELVERVWASDKPRGEETVRYHIKEIRQKLLDIKAPKGLIETVYGFGYRLNPLMVEEKQFSIEVPRPTVLVLVSDPALQAFIEQLLELHSLKVFSLSDEQQYWQTLAEMSIDLVIVDVDSPLAQGLELCQSTRQDSRWQKLPIIALIPQTTVNLVEKVFLAGANDFVSKPIIGPELLGRVLSRLPRAYPEPPAITP